ncbi:MAG: VWA domain-containing protein [Merismopedia sp. SIO2A8]|nr:VWA domain-containing protein [Merismopedia sp. SIO2A8]
MRVGVDAALNDTTLSASQSSSQRQIAISVSALGNSADPSAPLNLCLILDHSGSMKGAPLETVKQAANKIIDKLSVGDRISIIAFDHEAKVLVANQQIEHPAEVKRAINNLKANGGTAIDEGMRLGIAELAKGKEATISQAFLLTDGENEHGDNERCLKLAELAASYNLTLNSLGFGNHWNQDVLEKIADRGGGTLSHIEQPEDAVGEFNRLFERIQSVALTNAYLLMTLDAKVRLAELKPVAQVMPDTIELLVLEEAGQHIVRLGDLMVDAPRVVLANVYVGQMAEGTATLVNLQIRYENPTNTGEDLFSEIIPVTAMVQAEAQPQLNDQVQKHVLTLAKYRQTQIAETKLNKGDRVGAATMLQHAAKTAIQMGDQNAATVLQHSATQLQAGQELSESDRKKTRIASKTVLQRS